VFLRRTSLFQPFKPLVFADIAKSRREAQAGQSRKNAIGRDSDQTGGKTLAVMRMKQEATP
jgi:hypothetical protein